MSKVSINLAFGPWTVLENNAIVHICIKDWEQMMETKEVVRQCLEERGVQNITIEVDISQSNHAQHRRRVRELEQKQGASLVKSKE